MGLPPSLQLLILAGLYSLSGATHVHCFLTKVRGIMQQHSLHRVLRLQSAPVAILERICSLCLPASIQSLCQIKALSAALSVRGVALGPMGRSSPASFRSENET